MEFKLLGSLVVTRHGREVPLTARKPQALLAMLLLESGRVVSSRRLLGELWEHEPPRSALPNLRTYAAHLRKVVFEGESGRVVTEPAGYRLQLNGDRLDAAEFDRLCREGRRAHLDGRAVAALERYGRARTLWRGTPLLGVNRGPTLAAASVALGERYATVTETCFELRLELAARDRHRDEYAELVADLRSYLAEHPLRELPWRLLVLALYRFGDIAAALGAYAQARATFRDTLGLEPSPDLRALQQAVLRRDPAIGARPFVEQDLPGTVRVLVCGPRSGTEHERRTGAELGRLIAARGAAVVGRDDEVGQAAVTSARAAGGAAITACGNGPGRIDAVIAVSGSWYALAQVAAAKQADDLPVVQLGGWTILDRSGGPVPGVQPAENPADAVRRVLGEQ
ncbi:BTAD domain-containing putative transcriptional regulator [Flindersiella endophytica]